MRIAAISVDSKSTVSIPLAQVWQRLVAGERRLADSFCTNSRCYLVLRKLSNGRAALPERKLSMLERAIVGGSHKLVAYEFGISASSVSGAIRECLTTLGWCCSPRQVPLAAVLLVHASADHEMPWPARASTLGPTLEVVSVASDDLELRSSLSPGEHAVVSALIEGLSYDEIARTRNVSARTVANQIASAFRRLGVSGRLELLSRLAQSAGRASPPRAPLPA